MNRKIDKSASVPESTPRKSLANNLDWDLFIPHLKMNPGLLVLFDLNPEDAPPTVRKMIKEFNDRQNEIKFQAAMLAGDESFLIEHLDFSSQSISPIVQEKLHTIYCKQLEIRRLRKIIASNEDYCLKPQELEFAKEFLMPHEVCWLERKLVRAYWISSGKKILQSLIDNLPEKFDYLNHFKQLWQNNIFPGNWHSLMEKLHGIEMYCVWKRALTSNSDRALIQAWNTPTDQFSLSDRFNTIPKEHERRLDGAKWRLGALTQIEWIRKYNHGRASEKFLIACLQDSDLPTSE